VTDRFGAAFERVRAIASAQRDAISSRQLREILHPRQIQRAVAEGRLMPLWRGIYVVRAVGADSADSGGGTDGADSGAGTDGTIGTGGTVGVWTRLAAAMLTLDRPIVACLDTAAEIRGFLITPSTHTHVLTAGTALSERSGLIVHRYRPMAAPTRLNGILVEDPTECAIRLAARQRGLPAVLSILDAALHSGAVGSVDALCGVAVRMTGRGVRDVCRMAPLAHGGARSAADSWIRWLCLDRNFDVPEIGGRRPGRNAVDESPVLASADYRWPRYRVAATLTITDDRRLAGMHVVHGVVPGTGWTHLFVESLPAAACTPGVLPIHPAAQARLQTVLFAGRRQWILTPGRDDSVGGGDGADRRPLRRPQEGSLSTLASRVDFRPPMLQRPRRGRGGDRGRAGEG
jgi:hypothetical protein